VHLNPAVFDVWAFRRSGGGVEFLLLLTSQAKADRHFNGGRFWQIPSGEFHPGEAVVDAVDRLLTPYGLRASAIWAAEHTYTIYNRRFEEIQMVTVFAAEVDGGIDEPRLQPEEHAESRWLPLDEALRRLHYRGLKDGLRSVGEYITGVASPAPELRLR